MKKVSKLHCTLRKDPLPTLWFYSCQLPPPKSNHYITYTFGLSLKWNV